MSARQSEEVSEYERQYEDGSDPRVLDVLDVPLLEPRPRHYQSENWLLDPQRYWTFVDRLTWTALLKLVDAPKRLWINSQSTYHGVNDEIAQITAEKLETSLRLIHVDGVTLRVFRPGADFGDQKRRVQAKFHYVGEQYWLRVTDPGVEKSYIAKGEGEYPIGECCLAISLGELFKGNCYKLVAAIILNS